MASRRARRRSGRYVGVTVTKQMYLEFMKQKDDQIDSLRETLRRERLTSSTALEEQVRKMEAEHESMWNERMQNKVTDTEKTWATKLSTAEVGRHPRTSQRCNWERTRLQPVGH